MFDLLGASYPFNRHKVGHPYDLQCS